jgi:hypothetical protein
VVAVACPPICFVPVLVRGMPVLRVAMIVERERWGVADAIGRDTG